MRQSVSRLLRSALPSLVATIPPLVCGCASHPREVQNWLMAYQEPSSSIEYRVGIPDTIAVTAPQIPEIDGERQVIQPHGKISLRLLGEVHVDGMTVKEIAAKLTTLLKEYYENPKVQVRVAGYASKKIYVFGQVGGGLGGGGASTSGGQAMPYTGRNTLLDTLADAGLNIIAWRSQIKVIRANPEKHKRHVINVDIDRMVEKGDTSMNLLLEPGDIVYVPPTPLGWVGLRVQEMMFPLSPIMNGYAMPATMMNAHDVSDEHRTD